MTLLEELRDLWFRMEMDLGVPAENPRSAEWYEWSAATKGLLMAAGMRWDWVSDDYIFPDPRWNAFCEMWSDVFCGMMHRG